MRIAVGTMIVVLIAAHVGATDYYVSTTGSNSNSGKSLSQSFLTIQQAANVAAAGDTVYVLGGTYRETVTVPHSGTATAPITFEPYENAQVTISGLDLAANWSDYSGSIYSSTVNSVSQVFVNGQMMTEARWPNSSANNPLHAVYATVDSSSINSPPATSTITDSALPTGSNFAGSQMVITPGSSAVQAWYAYNTPITSQSGKTLSFQWTTGHSPAAGNNYYLYGSLNQVDASKEYYYDSTGKKLYLYAPGGANPNTQTVEVRTRTYGFNLGSQSYVNVSGFQLMAASVNVAGNYNTLNNLQILYASPFSTVAWGDTHSGGINLSGQYNTLQNSEVAYSWGNGIAVIGNNNTINNNVIHDVDWAGTDAVAIDVRASGSTMISNNTIYNTGRSGILNGKATVINNDISRFGFLSNDLGGTYADTGGNGAVIAYNYIHNGKASASQTGVYLDNSSEDVAKDNGYNVNHNLITDLPNGTAIRMNAPATNNNIDNNTMWNVTNGAIVGQQSNGPTSNVNVINNLTNSTNVRWDGTTISNNLNLTTDPFINSAANNYTPTPGSAPVDAGMVIPGITDGYAGSAPDVGAFESGTTAWTAGANWKTWQFGNQTVAPLTSALYVQPNGTRVTTGALQVGNSSSSVGNDDRAFLKFNLSGITAPIQSAVLRIYDVGGTNSQNGGASVYQVLSNWSDTTVAYGQAIAAAGTSFYDPDNADLYTQVDITSIVQGWLANPSTNFGLSIRGTEGLTLSAKYFGGTYDVTPPQLLLTYTTLSPGDFNFDGHVDAKDVSAMLAALSNLNSFQNGNNSQNIDLSDSELETIGDINGDGQITNADLQDLIDVLKAGGGSTSAVPEPSSIALTFIAAAFWWAACKRSKR